MSTKESCLLRATFFGLTNDYIQGVYESFFMMIQVGNWSFFDIYALPVALRKWFISRTVKYFDEKNKSE